MGYSEFFYYVIKMVIHYILVKLRYLLYIYINLIKSYESNIKKIFYIFKKIETFFDKISKFTNPDFFHLKNQYRILLSKVLMENGYYKHAIKILLMTFEVFQLELKIRKIRENSKNIK